MEDPKLVYLTTVGGTGYMTAIEKITTMRTVHPNHGSLLPYGYCDQRITMWEVVTELVQLVV